VGAAWLFREIRRLRYLFEDYCLDTARRELRHLGALVRLEPQVFDVLEYLIRERARMVRKDDLMASIWDGRIVSESALTTRINAARTAIGDSGKQQRLIKTVPRRGIRFVGNAREEDEPSHPVAAEAAAEWRAPSLPDKPSIAVLPFANLSGDPGQDYFTDGIVEDIITSLSRMGWLFVIARNSSFAYKSRAVDVKQVGRELGVRYILEGSVRKAANRVRIAVQLIDASTGTHVTAERFDGTVQNIFDLQDEITTGIIGAISPRLETAEIARAKRKPTESLDAYDNYLRGMAAVYRWTNASHDEALRLFRRAIELDPDFATAYGVAARCYSWRASDGRTVDKAREVDEVRWLARRAVELGKDDAVALHMAGHAIARVAGDVAGGASLIDRALLLNPNLASAWLSSGWVSVWLGEPDRALERFARAMRFSPVDLQLFNMQAGAAVAHFIAGRDNDALVWAAKALACQPGFGPALRVAAASYALMERPAEAKNMTLRLREADPGLRLSNLQDRVAWPQSEALARLVAGLRHAGVPE
jgi:TolB-like protein/tetratricopeptide (TPR) repeat protein